MGGEKGMKSEKGPARWATACAGLRNRVVHRDGRTRADGLRRRGPHARGQSETAILADIRQPSARLVCRWRDQGIFASSRYSTGLENGPVSNCKSTVRHTSCPSDGKRRKPQPRRGIHARLLAFVGGAPPAGADSAGRAGHRQSRSRFAETRFRGPAT